jgi:acetoin utilization deacetylase AcuC-like enzyme
VILFDPTLKVSLQEFGIQIPLYDTRASRTLERLCAHPILGPLAAQWHIDTLDEPVTEQDLLRVHGTGYVARLFSDRLEEEIACTYELIDETGRYHRYDPASAALPLRRLFARILRKAGGTVQCCRIALREGFCFYFAGGMHHAHRHSGSGFCPINDIVIAIRKLQNEGAIRRVWVIDVDAHKGDGTAALTRDDDSVRTFSIHMAAGWPLDGQRYDAAGDPNPAFIASDVDIAIRRDENPLYLDRLKEGLERLARFPEPDLAMVVCGADPYEKDELPSTVDLQQPLERLLKRDQTVYRFLAERNIPGAFLMAGGYGRHSWRVYTQFLEWALLERIGSAT